MLTDYLGAKQESIISRDGVYAANSPGANAAVNAKEYFLPPTTPAALCDFGVNGFIKKYIVSRNIVGIFQQEYDDFSVRAARAPISNPVPARSAWCHEINKFFLLLFRNSFVSFLPAGRESPTATINRSKHFKFLFDSGIKPLVLSQRVSFIF